MSEMREARFPSEDVRRFKSNPHVNALLTMQNDPQAALSKQERSGRPNLLTSVNCHLTKSTIKAIIKTKRTMIRKSSLATSKQTQSEHHVTKHAGVIQDKADDLVVVWNLVGLFLSPHCKFNFS